MKHIFRDCLVRHSRTQGGNYTIPQLDLSVMPENTEDSLKYLYEPTVLDFGEGYLGHPDSVLLLNGDILTFYPEGHGKGAILGKVSSDGGKSYSDFTNAPPTWRRSRETPTVYRLEFSSPDVPDKLILISGNPKWGVEPTTGGFNCSISEDEGKSFSEFELFYPELRPIVAMASLTRLKENAVFCDKWMALFHDSKFRNYMSVLTFDQNGQMCWSVPEKYMQPYRSLELGSKMCEVECIRSDGGKGDELCLLTRSNSKLINSLVSFSQDEGKSWSKPVELPPALNGERHKADYLPDGRLFITFRSIERDEEKCKKCTGKHSDWFSEGWVAWVGTYDDIKNGREGQYRIKIAHTYLDAQTAPEASANADTGYCGNVVLHDGTIVTSTYGAFSSIGSESGCYFDQSGQKRLRTYIISKRIRLSDTDRLLKADK